MKEKQYTGGEKILELSKSELSSMIEAAKEEGFQCGMKYKRKYEKLRESVNCTATLLKSLIDEE